MDIKKITNSIINSNTYQNITKSANRTFTKIGNAFETSPKKDFFQKGIKLFEPTGANNSFLGLASLMVGTVLIPRVITAAKRNPDNKEATKDEMTEILFRDCQTIIIMLFGLKVLNALISGKVSKMTGLPLTNKPYLEIFSNQEKGIKGVISKVKEFCENPKDKFKKIGKNILDTIHPTKGVYNLSDPSYIAKYSGFEDIQGIQKMLDNIELEKGDKEKIFSKVMKNLVASQQELIDKQTKLKNAGLESNIEKAQQILKELIEINKKGTSSLQDLATGKYSEQTTTQIIEYLKDANNILVKDAKKLTAGLRTGALAFEATYLGFGLPALNQIRLENKYLKKCPKEATTTVQEDDFNPLLNTNLKEQEIKLYQNFLTKA